MTSTWKVLLVAKYFFYWITGPNFPAARKERKERGWGSEGRLQLEADQEDNKDIRKMSRELLDFRLQTDTVLNLSHKPLMISSIIYNFKKM